MVDGGAALLPGLVVHEVPHPGLAGLSSRPLKPEGAGPPLSLLVLAHWDPQNVTIFPVAPETLPTPASPTTNEPPELYPNIHNFVVASAQLPPVSQICVDTVYGPSAAYAWVPLTTKPEPFALTIPAEVGPPSPQSM